VKGKDAKPHIGIFGRRNNGKSTLINCLAQQDIAIVSEIPGTTTDPVKKSIEIPGIGPVVLIDTAGMDDSGSLGAKRVGKTKNTISKIDMGILVLAQNQFSEPEAMILSQFQKWEVPFIILHNKADVERVSNELKNKIHESYSKNILEFTAIQPHNLEEIIQAIKAEVPESSYTSRSLVGDLIKQGDIVLLITPIDVEAPEGRLILPQVQAIRDILDNDAIAIVVKEREVDKLIRQLHPRPVLAVTDSQAFLKADASIPEDIPLTSFSILLARYKGDFDNYLKGTPSISSLKNNDRILILESCTHHVSCDDIGRVKIPRWLSNFTGKKIDFTVVSGLDDIPENITDYAMVIQCGGCMITHKQIINRLKPAVDAGIPVTNYGMAIAYMHGIFDRAIEPFTGKRDHINTSYL
jgi:[FeFe] hydrogenase H-cluster maturation GTPase HydF